MRHTLLILLLGFAVASTAADAPKVYHNLNLKLRKKVQPGEVFLKVPKSDVRNCDQPELTWRHRYTGNLTIDTSVLGAPYPANIQIPIDKLVESKVKRGRKQFNRVKLLIYGGQEPQVRYMGFSIKDEPAKCD